MLLFPIAPSLVAADSGPIASASHAPIGDAVLRTYLCSCLTAVFLVLLAANGAQAQCILANPSFEIGGTSGKVFGGWNQFGSVGSSANATHGAKAARVSGPNTGNWDVSGYWQRFDCAPGESWSVSVDAWHTATKPLTGQCKAIVNVEWRGASDNLISYESHTAADASTPQGEVQELSFQTLPAPTGTVSARLLLGVLQSPTDPSPDVYYDQATFYSLTPPTQDEIQWNDFPGGRTIDFSGRTWRVKGPGYYGPGPSLYSDAAGNVWVDVDDRLHVTVQKSGGLWYSTEVALVDALGYGDYIFTTVGRLDTLDPNVVLGLFVWEYGPCYDPSYLWWNPYNEFDIEISRWGNPSNDVGQFVAQPYDYPGNISRFAANFSDGELTSHAFRWLPDRVECRSWRGGPDDEDGAVMLHTWTYEGPHIPRPEQPRVHINLWRLNTPAANQEVVLDEFTFVPMGLVVGIPDIGPDTRFAPSLSVARPNPFNPSTTIGYTLPRGGDTELVVYDIEGRRVRTLVKGFVPAGDHGVVWDGRDDAGNRVASGVYLYRLRAGAVVETKKMVLVK
jgi:hypothetical protein